MPYKLVCFDMDGVLYSSENMIAGAFHEAGLRFAEKTCLDIPQPDLPAIMDQIGKPIKTIFQKLYPTVGDIEREEISHFTLDALVRRVRAREGVLLPDATRLLKQLSAAGIHIGLASNGRAGYLDAILETYALSPYFPNRVVVDGDGLPDKASLIVHSMERYSVSSSNTLMVGDRMTDYEAARKAGVDFACVVSGHGDDFSNEIFEYAITRLGELLPVVLGGDSAGI